MSGAADKANGKIIILSRIFKVSLNRKNNIKQQIIHKKIVEEDLNGLNKPVAFYHDVMIVDDDEFQLNAIIGLLAQAEQCNYIAATNGIIAVDVYKRRIQERGIQFSLILMDLRMPFKTGYEASKEIREFERSENLPRTLICGISSDKYEGIEEKCKENGMDNFIFKPVSIHSIRILFEEIKKKEKEQK